MSLFSGDITQPPVSTQSSLSTGNEDSDVASSASSSASSEAESSFGMSSQHGSNISSGDYVKAAIKNDEISLEAKPSLFVQLEKARLRMNGGKKSDNDNSENDEYNDKEHEGGDELLVGFDTDSFNDAKKMLNEEEHDDLEENEYEEEEKDEEENTSSTTKKDEESIKYQEKFTPSLEPYFARLEKFELFSTNQTYFLVGCDKHKSSYRVLRMDRNMIENPHPKRPYSNYDSYYNNINRTPSSYPNDPHNFQSTQQSGAGASSFNSSTSNPKANRSQSVEMQDTNLFQGQKQQQHTLHDPLNRNQPNSFQQHRPPANRGYYNTTDGTSNSNYSNSPMSQPQPQSTSNSQHQSYGQYNPQKSAYRRLPDFCIEDPHVYSEEEIQQVLDMIHDGNKNAGGLRPVVKAYGIVGFIRFLDCYYLTLITKRTKVGQIGSNGIYTIKSTETFPLKQAESGFNHEESSPHPGDPSSMLLNMWNRGKRAAGLGQTQRELELRYLALYHESDLTKNYFFSYTYDMTRSVQENFISMTAKKFPPPPFKNMYAWNYFLTRELEECTSSDTSTYWILPIIHGAFIQRKISDYGRSLNLTLLARRSRHFAGTRYLKRGVSDRGKVANDVEHEQILHDESGSGAFSSFLQMRGSIPTYWTQESSVTMPKPPIVLNRVDPTYSATQLHFEDLLKRYSSPIVVLDLVKQSEKREREVIVGNEYRHAIDYLNSYIEEKHKIRYCALDYSHISKHRNLNVSSSLNDVATWSVNQTGFFCSKPRWKISNDEIIEPYETPEDTLILSGHLGIPIFPMEQKGVLRTNCIDCLDRTNVAQFSAGVASLAQQLVVMGIRSSVKLDPTSNIVRVLINMYVEIGDHIAIQYGGSEAHKKVATAQVAAKEGPSAGKHKELLTSMRRYYSNTFQDRMRQDAMNLFLGYYIPFRHTIPLWDMESDYYLHNFHIRAGQGSLKTMKSYEEIFAVDWSDDEDTQNESGLSISPIKKIKPLNPKHTKTNSADFLIDTFNKSDIKDKIKGIQKRCHKQNKDLSIWWKVAIHANIKERMWMKLESDSPESDFPSRFDRLYQPEKLAQFDKYFSRNYTTPLRLSHSAQHAQSADDAKETIRSAVSSSDTNSPSNQVVAYDYNSDSDESTSSEESYHTIDDFIQKHGFQSSNNSSLSHFTNHHERKLQPIQRRMIENENKKDESGRLGEGVDASHFLGRHDTHSPPCDEYLNYANYSKNFDYSFRKFRSGAKEELSKCLHETNLESNNVEGIRKLAESAHISSKINTGSYRGLSETESASKVTTVLNECYEKLLNGENNVSQDHSLLLKRNHMETTGIKDEISLGWSQLIQSKNIYGEILDCSNMTCRRSDLTSERSMKLYTSFYDGDTELTRLKRMYILGNTDESRVDKITDEEKSSKSTGKSEIKNKEKKHRNREKAKDRQSKRLGKRDNSSCKHNSSSSSQIHEFIPIASFGDYEGFEQINEDLYARKDNKFMVFNGAGVDTWDGTKPVTKSGGIMDLFTN